MNTAVLTMSVAFAATSTGLLAVGLFVRDLILGGREEPRGLTFAPRPVINGKIDERFHRMVDEAGMPMEYGAALMSIVGGGLIGLLVGLLIIENLLAAAVGMLLGCGIPIMILQFIRWRRVSHMRKHLPITLQIIADAVRSGHTLEESFQMAAKESKGPLADEFEHASSQFGLGLSPIRIVDRLARRIPLPEFRVFATAVLVHRRAGGNLSLLTERMSRSARERQEVRGHVMAVTSGSRLSAIGMVVGSIIAMIVLWGMEPDYVRAFVEHPLGPTLLMIAGALQLVGVLWVWRVLRINY